jgi:hypothetical protein
LIRSIKKRNATIFVVLTAKAVFIAALPSSEHVSVWRLQQRPPDAERMFKSGAGEMLCGVTDEPRRRKLRLIGNNGSLDLGANVAPEGRSAAGHAGLSSDNERPKRRELCSDAFQEEGFLRAVS